MAGDWGYRSYRGKGSKRKIFLAILLVLVILAAAVVVLLQEHIVYDETGAPRLEVPWQEEASEATEESVELDLVIQEPAKEEELRGFTVPAGLLTQEACDAARAANPDCNAVAVTLKDSGSRVYFDAEAAKAGAVQTADDSEAVLMSLTGEDGGPYTIARVACFHDSRAASGDVEGMGLKNTGGYIFYDGKNSQWLDPAKPAARQYLCELAEEVAALGFQEILLTDVTYPTEGKLDKIAYGETARNENLCIFLEEMRAVLEPYQVQLSVELPAEVIALGQSDAAGLVLREIAPLVDRIYAEVLPEEAESFSAAVAEASQETVFIPVLAVFDAALTGSYLIQ